MTKMTPFDVIYEFSDVISDKKPKQKPQTQTKNTKKAQKQTNKQKTCFNAFVRCIDGKIKLKMVVPDVVQTSTTIKLCLNLRQTPTGTLNLLQVAGDAAEMKTYSV